jgi:hypothetical protein
VSGKPALSIVLAVDGAHENLPLIMASLATAGDRATEIVVCHDEHDRTTVQSLGDDGPPARLIAVRSGSRIPEMWRDGILAASADWVATLSTHVVPDPQWLARAFEIIAQRASCTAVGGSIVLSEPAIHRDRAIHWLRYLRYTPPISASTRAEPAADNALYRRAAILEEQDLLAEGFWEPSFHARFRAKGGVLAIDPELRAVHSNRYSTRAFCRQRLAHGRAFGHGRAAGRRLPARLALLLMSPLLPGVFLAKLSLAAVKHPFGRRTLFAALPWLLTYLAAWGIGESMGYLDALTGRSRASGAESSRIAQAGG